MGQLLQQPFDTEPKLRMPWTNCEEIMDLQARIAAALTDFDYLLTHRVSIEAALEVAAIENGVSVDVLKARASRTLTLEERRDHLIAKAELARDTDEKHKAQEMGSLFAAAYEAQKRLGSATQSEKSGTRTENDERPRLDRIFVDGPYKANKFVKKEQLKFKF